MNNFEIGRDKVIETFELKGFKTWTAREGYGAQGTVYHNGKKIALVTDEGVGGEIDVDATTRDNKQLIDNLINTLPPFTNRERNWNFNEDESQEWDVKTWGDVMLQLGEYKKQFNRHIKKVSIVHDKNLVGVAVFKYPASKLEDPELRKFIKVKHPDGIILNDLDKKEAFRLFMRHCSNEVSKDGQPINK